MMFLRQSTAQVISFGPCLDATDGVTLETGLVSGLDHATTGIMLSKNGGALAVRSAAVTASTYDAHGCYRVTLSATDTDTLEALRVVYTDAATLRPVVADFMVLPALVYDAIVEGTSELRVDVRKVNGNAANPTATIDANIVSANGDGDVVDNFVLAYNGTGFNVGGGDIEVASVTGLTVANLDTVLLWVKRNAVILSGLVSGAGTASEVFTISSLGITATVVADANGNRTSVTWS